MKEEIRLQLAQNTHKRDKLYAKQVWAVIIFCVSLLLFIGGFIKEISAPKINPTLMVGGLFGFVFFLVLSLGIWLLLERGMKKIGEERKNINLKNY